MINLFLHDGCLNQWMNLILAFTSWNNRIHIHDPFSGFLAEIPKVYILFALLIHYHELREEQFKISLSGQLGCEKLNNMKLLQDIAHACDHIRLLLFKDRTNLFFSAQTNLWISNELFQATSGSKKMLFYLKFALWY